MKKHLKFIVFLFAGLIYGILIGKYEFFPHAILKSIQDTYEDVGKDAKTPKKFTTINVQDLISVTPKNIDSLKLTLNDIVFGANKLPTSLPTSINRIQDDAYSDSDNLDYLEQFEISNNYDIKSIGYIFHPQQSNNRLMLYHQGHLGDFIHGKETITYFLKEGFTIYAFSMPLLGKNNQPTISLDKLGEIYLDDHERLKYLDHPLQYFITPVISMLNYANDKNFQDATMIGISGGGWTTTLASAIDSRINYSFPVAGSYPMFIRFRKPDTNYGDFEQTYEQLFSRINYLDLYVMGSVGKNRFQLQILNEFDPCCYNGDDYKTYTSSVSNSVQKFGEGEFSVFLDAKQDEHIISEVVLAEILEKLNATSNKK